MKGKKILYLEQLRALASILVVVIHVASQNWKVIDVNSINWQIMNIYDSFARVAVPIFVMISGAIFLSKDRSYKIKDLFKKYIIHIFLVLIIWSFFYAIFYYLKNGETLAKFWTRFVGGHYHLWYLFMLIGLYLILPLLKKITESKELTEYFLILSFVLTTLLPTLIKFPFLKWMNDPFSSLHYHFTVGYSSYFVLGHYLHEYELNSKQQKLIYVLGIFGLLFTIVSTYFMSQINQTAYKGFYNNFCFGVVFEAIAIFVYFKYRSIKCVKIPLFIAKYSFGVYLVHVFVIDQLKIMGLHTLMCPAVLSVPIMIVLVFMISLVISYLLNHIRFLAKYIF